MKRNSVFLAPVLLLGLSPAALAWRSSVSSLWPEKAVQIDGRGSEWPEWPVVDENGVAVRAMNDASNLYLLIGGSNDDGRVVLSGKYKQDITLWFLKPDHTIRDWGIDIDFSHGHSPDPAMMPPSLNSYGVIPGMLQAQGAQVSTTTLSPDIALQTDLSTEFGRQPVYEMSIPLAMLQRKGRSIFVDLFASDLTTEMRTQFQSDKSEPPAAGAESHPEDGDAGGNHGGHHHDHDGGGAPHPTELPKPLHLHLTIKLAAH